MAIDYEAAEATADELRKKAHELHSLIQLARDAKFTKEHLGEVALTAAQKSTLAADYTTLKSEIQTLFSQLP